MGTSKVTDGASRAARAQTARAIVDDTVALERMLAAGMLDDGPARIGAEQEMLLVDDHLCPAPLIGPMLEKLGDRRFTPELAVFDLEANLTPRFLAGRSLGALHDELAEVCRLARAAAKDHGAHVLLTGFLPTYEPCLVHMGQVVQTARYVALNRRTVEPRGGALHFAIHGRDTLDITLENIMLEGGATSFQVHLQVAPDEFASTYNAALLTAAPLVAVCANSPLVFGHRLWHESRVALYETSADIRSASQLRRPGRTRASLGDGWVERSPLEILRRDLCRFEPVFAVDPYRSSTDELRSGRIPALKALAMFNGTVYRWMRPCYGVTDGRPHLRIENRLLPSGPTLADEVANAALWIGLMRSIPATLGGAPPALPFTDAEENLHAAARSGLEAPLRWLDGERLTAKNLLLRLLPLARDGLRAAAVEEDDITRYLGIIARRLATGRTGAQWMLDAFDALPPELSRSQRSWRVAESLLALSAADEPVHAWPSSGARYDGVRVPAVASMLDRAPIAVSTETPIVFARKLLEWARASHLVVEATEGRFVGLLTLDDLPLEEDDAIDERTVSDVVRRDTTPILSADAPIDRALAQLRAAGRACAVVLRGEQAAGIVHERDLARAMRERRAPPVHG